MYPVMNHNLIPSLIIPHAGVMIPRVFMFHLTIINVKYNGLELNHPPIVYRFRMTKMILYPLTRDLILDSSNNHKLIIQE